MAAPDASFTAAFITGHSVPGCTGLSRGQRWFQEQSAIGPQRWLPCNFPWQETTPFPDKNPLVRASLSNLRHYLHSRRPAFRETHREAAIRLLGGFETVVLLAGSCGLELLANLDLPGFLRDRLHVFACGPVSRTVPLTASLVSVQGSRDWITRWFHPRATYRISCGHMGYLRHPETLRLFDQFCTAAGGGTPSQP